MMKMTKKTDFNKLISSVIKNNYTFYGPVKEDDYIKISKLDNKTEIVFDYNNIKLPVKRLFFPGSEVLFTYKNSPQTTDPVATGVHDRMRVIFGLRPCDAASLALLDKVFIDDKYTDPHFVKKRDNSIIITLACKELKDSCFCTSVNGSPVSDKGADILCYNLDDYLFFRGCTEKGDGFLDSFSVVFNDPGQSELAAKQEFEANAEKNKKSIDLCQIEQKLDNKSINDPFFRDIARSCLACGICTYLCPTCHCFGLHDEQNNSFTQRIRVQDSCMHTNFTAEASGHNPRQGKALRIRQRIMHKFCYTKENFGEFFCVGCGRCIEYCPVNIDIRETIAEVNR